MEIDPMLRGGLNPYLPTFTTNDNRCYVTLTYAQSLDSKIAAKKGERTAISHNETKEMTHYLRSKHEGILVGINTFLADDPSLRNKYDNHLIRPIILDPNFKIEHQYPNSQLLSNVEKKIGLKPLIIVSDECYQSRKEHIDSFCVQYPIEILALPTGGSQINWDSIFITLKQTYNINSVMVEGGAFIINTLLLKAELVDALIVTLGPVYLGEEGVSVSPAMSVSLKDVKWWYGEFDSVLIAKLK